MGKKAGLKKYSVMFDTKCQLFVCENETKWYTLWHSTQTLPKHSFLSKYQTLPWYTCKCNFIFSHRKSANFHDAHNNSVHLCGNVYLIFFPLTSVKKCRKCGQNCIHSTNFHITHNHQWHYVDISYIKLQTNWSRNMETTGRDSFTPLGKV